MECTQDTVECIHGGMYTRWSVHMEGHTLTKTYSRQKVHPVGYKRGEDLHREKEQKYRRT